MTAGPHFRNFYNRMFKCSYFKETPNYGTLTRAVINKALVRVRDRKETFLEAFSKAFSHHDYSRTCNIDDLHREYVKQYILSCSANIQDMLTSYQVTDFMDRYNYKWKIHGEISGILHTEKVDYNLHLEYMNESIDFHCLNNYIYNQSKGKSNDLLVFYAKLGTLTKVTYDSEDYTIIDGFFKLPRRLKLRLRGHHCFGCLNKCKSQYIRDLKLSRLYL